MIDDATLLHRYAVNRSEEAFTELVGRHLPLVYSAALRRLDGDTHRAADVAQGVFAALARDAARLSRHAVLAGWLYTATRNAAIDVVRAEQRRRVREREAHTMQEISGQPEIQADWARLRPVLDGVMDQLGARDRDAVLLRFFQGRQFLEIANVLGVSEDAARKRVERATEKLRSLLRRHGITSTSAALASVVAGETTVAAPAGLATSVIGAALAGGGATVSAVTFMTVTKLQAGIAAAVLVGGTVGLISQHRTIAELRDTRADLQQQLAKSATVNATTAKARVAADAELAKLHAALAVLKTGARDAMPRAESTGATQQGFGHDAIAQRTIADNAALQQKKAERHRRYDPFLLQQRGLTSAQADRFVELMIQQADARQDLQASVQEVGMSGDGFGVEALRSKLYEPILKELRELLGEDGYAAYLDYEKTSFYRIGFVDRMIPMFTSANVPLSAEQAEQITHVVAANDHPQRLKPTDIGSESRIDWDAVAVQASTMLTPAQTAVVRAYANQEKSAKRTP